MTGKVTLAGTAVMASAGTALAQTPFNIDGNEVAGVGLYSRDLDSLVSNIVNVVLVVVGFITVIYLIYGGITYVTAGGDAEKASKGRITITNAIIGVIIIVASLAIYNYVLSSVN